MSLRFGTTLGLGLVSFFLFVILTLTGLALMLYYVPHPDAAYRSMRDIEHAVTFGMLLRNAHRWAAHGMVVTVFLHLCRVFFTGAYKAPREFNWVVGVSLLLLTLALSFTGLSPAVGPARLLGHHRGHGHRRLRAVRRRRRSDSSFSVATTSARAALLRFYVLHCLILPLPWSVSWRSTSGGCAKTEGLRHRAMGGTVESPPGPTSSSES